MYSVIAPDSAMVLPRVGDDRRLSERVDRAQFGRRAHVRLPLVADDLVRSPKFFQQPQHALGSRIVEMMDDEHGDSPGWMARLVCRLVVAAGRGKVEARAANIVGALLTHPICTGNIR